MFVPKHYQFVTFFNQSKHDPATKPARLIKIDDGHFSSLKNYIMICVIYPWEHVKFCIYQQKLKKIKDGLNYKWFSFAQILRESKNTVKYTTISASNTFQKKELFNLWSGSPASIVRFKFSWRYEEAILCRVILLAPRATTSLRENIGKKSWACEGAWNRAERLQTRWPLLRSVLPT